MQIIPSVLEHSPQDYINQISRLSPYFTHFQLDIADGILVPNKTAPLKDILSYLTTNYKPQTMNSFVFDFHLMLTNITTNLGLLRALKTKLRIDTILIHYGALETKPFAHYLQNFSDLGEIGLVLNPEDEVETISHEVIYSDIPAIQIMTVIPGKQGSPFIEKMINKIGQLRKIGYRNKIAVDGGVNPHTLKFMIHQKQVPNIICPGSYFTKAKDYELKDRVVEMNSIR